VPKDRLAVHAWCGRNADEVKVWIAARLEGRYNEALGLDGGLAADGHGGTHGAPASLERGGACNLEYYGTTTLRPEPTPSRLLASACLERPLSADAYPQLCAGFINGPPYVLEGGFTRILVNIQKIVVDEPSV
jgi:hypothetical protein